MKKIYLILGMFVLLLTACTQGVLSQSTPTAEALKPTEPVGLANPASVNCENQGGTLEIRQEAGGQAGYCHLPDGTICEEWAYFRGECGPVAGVTEPAPQIANPASQHCVEQGGTLEIRDEANGQVGYCIFPEGECEEWAFMRGECSIGKASENQAATPDAALHASGVDTLVYYSDCFDLDTGDALGGDDPACEFTVHPGENNSGTIEFIPADPAAFGFEGAFREEPTAEQCKTSTHLKPKTEVIAIIDYYVCYQTRDGRYGSMFFKSMDDINGIVIDWKTYE